MTTCEHRTQGLTPAQTSPDQPNSPVGCSVENRTQDLTPAQSLGRNDQATGRYAALLPSRRLNFVSVISLIFNAVCLPAKVGCCTHSRTSLRIVAAHQKFLPPFSRLTAPISTQNPTWHSVLSPGIVGPNARSTFLTSRPLISPFPIVLRNRQYLHVRRSTTNKEPSERLPRNKVTIY